MGIILGVLFHFLMGELLVNWRTIFMADRPPDCSRIDTPGVQ
jgi:hypothetical protein